MSTAIKIPSMPGDVEPPWPQLPAYRFSVEQYHRMIEAAILTGNDRVELLEGLILPKITHNPPHDAAVSLVQAELLARLSGDWIVRIQSAITTANSEPEPDAVVTRGPARRYARSHPRSRDIALVVEVGDTTLRVDREFKGLLYAQARVPTYWIVNLVSSTVEVYTQPRSGQAPAYRQQQHYGRDEIVPLFLGGRELAPIAVRDLLP